MTIDAATEQRIASLERDLASNQDELRTLKRQIQNMRFAPESGGGQVHISPEEVVLNPYGLTPSSVQIE